ncbi:MAG: tetratricopeptide repeat protein [Acidobacteriota bacterium]
MDAPTAEDRLGRGPLVRTLAEMLTHSEQQTPMTIALLAEWGAGKSSFILQLKERIDRGPMDVEVAVDLVVQACDGLVAAHQRGIVHRDIKPGNLMITRDGTVKVLDFGLSKITAGASEITRSGTVMGTVAYMSPEQAYGDDAGPATDVWALGVILYEMVTGRRPFTGSNDLSVLFSVVHREPASPSEHRDDLPSELEWVIKRCLAKDLRDRYQTVEELRTDLLSLQPDAEGRVLPSRTFGRRFSPERVVRQLRRQPRRIAGAAMAIALAVAVGFLALPREPDPTSTPAAVSTVRQDEVERTDVAVGGIRPDGGASPIIGSVLEELVMHQLIADELAWLPRSKVESIAATRTLAAGVPPPSSLTVDLREMLGAEFLLTGRYQVEGSGLQVEMRLWRTDGPMRGRSVKEWTVVGDREDLVGLAGELATELGPALGVVPTLADPSTTMPPVMLSSSGLAQAADVREWLRAYEPTRALGRVSDLRAANPGVPWVELLWIDTLIQLGRERDAADTVAELESELRLVAWPLRLMATARAAEIRHDPATAAARWQAVLEVIDLLPVEWRDREGARLRALENLARAIDEVAFRNLLAEIDEPAEPRATLATAQLAKEQSRHADQLSAAERLLERLTPGSDPVLTGLAHLRAGEAHRRLGDDDLAFASFATAEEVFERAGFTLGGAEVAHNIGMIYWDRQDMGRARRAWQDASTLYGEIGNDRGYARAQGNRALTYRPMGELEVAAPLLEDALESYRREDDHVAESLTLVNLAETLFDLGRFDESEARYTEIRANIDDIGYPTAEAYMRNSYGQWCLYRGDLVAASEHLEKAVAVDEASEDKLSLADYYNDLADLRYLQGNLDAALDYHQAALEIYRQNEQLSWLYAESLYRFSRAQFAADQLEEARLGLEEAITILAGLDRLVYRYRASIALARVEFAMGELDMAERRLRTILDELSSGSVVLVVADAEHVLAEVLFAKGDLEGAAAAVARALAPFDGVDLPVLELPISITQATILAARDLDTGRERLTDLLTSATGGSLTPLELEARLALRAAGVGSADHLENLVREAEAGGFAYIARLARQARRDIDKPPTYP